jgi:hypothetical protein
MFKRAHDPPLYNGALAKWRSTKKGNGGIFGVQWLRKRDYTGTF